jgi:uncharacterized protein with FMN-binding domain
MKPAVVFVIVLMLLVATGPALSDTIEFANGAKLSGTIRQVDDAAGIVTLIVKIGGRSYARRYEFSTIRSITRNGQTREFGKPATPGGTPAGKTGSTRSETEILRAISTSGVSPPSWLASTRLNYPQTLDLNWPRPSGKWNARKHIAHYLYSNIVANQGRWREGIKFLHFVYDRSRSNATARNNAAKDLGRLYFEFFRDYPRAAYWLRQARLPTTDGQHAVLAECYYRMGSQEMALKSLAGKPAYVGTAKLLGAMGLTDQAVRVADTIAKRGRPREALLTAGDVLALAGRHPEALKYYKLVLTDRRPARNPQYLKRFQTRARQSIESIQLFELFEVSRLRDGSYVDSSIGYEGPLRVEVKVNAGKITDVRVLAHQEKQFYSALDDMPAKIIAQQTVKDIDATSGATITAQAIVNAAAKALKQAR